MPGDGLFEGIPSLWVSCQDSSVADAERPVRLRAAADPSSAQVPQRPVLKPSIGNQTRPKRARFPGLFSAVVQLNLVIVVGGVAFQKLAKDGAWNGDERCFPPMGACVSSSRARSTGCQGFAGRGLRAHRVS